MCVVIAATTAALSSEDFSGKTVIKRRIEIESIERIRKTMVMARIQSSKKSEFSTSSL